MLLDWKNLLQNPILLQQLQLIINHFADIPSTIISLEQQNVPLIQNLKMVDNFLLKLKSIPGEFGHHLSPEPIK